MKLSSQTLLSVSTVFLSVYFLSACVSTPTTVGFVEEGNEYYTEAVVQTVVATKTDAEINEIEEIKPEAAIEVRETYRSSKGYWQAAINYLQTGNEYDARWALEKSLALNPDSKVANELMYQLDVDAINALGSDNFEYKVQYGDSLSKLSKLYLDDSLKFYLLAKYNDIENPGRLVVGQTIQIPGSKTEYSIDPEEELKEESKDSLSTNNSEENKKTTTPQLLADAREMLAAGENMATIDLIENNVSDFNSNLEIKSVLVNAYYLEAKSMIDNENITQSKLLLSRAVELEPDNIEVNMMLIDMNEVDQAEVLFKKSLKALADNDLINAYDLIKRALAVQPGYQLAAAKKIEIEKSLAKFYYKQALMAQRKHELDQAIEYWDKVLALDNQNDNAKLYRSKAVSLKIKLDQFVSNQ